MANRLDDFFLPWQNRRKELKILALGLALFFLFSLGFFPCFFNERAALIERGMIPFIARGTCRTIWRGGSTGISASLCRRTRSSP